MWIGLQHFAPHETGDDERDLIVVGYDARRCFTIGSRAEALPEIVRMLRAVANPEGWTPRCRTCQTALDVPPLDDLEVTCASA